MIFLNIAFGIVLLAVFYFAWKLLIAFFDGDL